MGFEPEFSFFGSGADRNLHPSASDFKVQSNSQCGCSHRPQPLLLTMASWATAEYWVVELSTVVWGLRPNHPAIADARSRGGAAAGDFHPNYFFPPEPRATKIELAAWSRFRGPTQAEPKPISMSYL